MKRIIVFVLTAVFALSVSQNANAQLFKDRSDVTIDLNRIHLDASLTRFCQASKENQAEILNELLRQANEAYVNCETVEEVYDLRQRLNLIKNSYMTEAKKAVVRQVSIQHAVETLETKILKTLREYEGGTLVFQDSNVQYNGR